MPALQEGTFPQDKGSFPRTNRAPRVPKTLPIIVWEASAESARKCSGAILDLSDHGLRVVTAKALEQGQMVSVLLRESRLCFKRCRVVWTRPSTLRKCLKPAWKFEIVPYLFTAAQLD